MTRVVVALARRAMRNNLRRPQLLAPLVIFPTLFLAVNVGGLTETKSLQGFPPVRSFLDFQLAGALTQSLLLGGVSTGIASALEIEGGFFDRLVASPIPRVAIVFGRLLAAGLVAGVQVLFFLGLGLAFGAEIAGGALGVLVVLGIGMVAGIGFGALGQALGLYARNASTVQGIFPLVLVILFVSSAFFPRALLSAPADSIARFNPLSYLADGLRDPIISTVSLEPVLEGLAAAAGIAVVAMGLSVLALRGQLRDA